MTTIDLNYKLFNINSTAGFAVLTTVSTIGPYAFILSIVRNSPDKYIRICKDINTPVPDINAAVTWDGSPNVNGISAYPLRAYKSGTHNFPLSQFPPDLFKISCGQIITDNNKIVSNTLIPTGVVQQIQQAKPSVHQQIGFRNNVSVDNLIFQKVFLPSGDAAGGYYAIYNINTPLIQQYDNQGGIQSLINGKLTFSWAETPISSQCVTRSTNQLIITFTSDQGFYISPHIVSSSFVPTASNGIIPAGSFTLNMSVNYIFYIYYAFTDSSSNYSYCFPNGLNFKVTQTA